MSFVQFHQLFFNELSDKVSPLQCILGCHALHSSSACWTSVSSNESSNNNKQTHLHDDYASFFLPFQPFRCDLGGFRIKAAVAAVVLAITRRLLQLHFSSIFAFFSFLWFAVRSLKAFGGLLGLFACNLMTVISSMKSLTGSAAAARTEKCCFVRRLLLSQTLLKRRGCRQQSTVLFVGITGGGGGRGGGGG